METANAMPHNAKTAMHATLPDEILPFFRMLPPIILQDNDWPIPINVKQDLLARGFSVIPSLIEPVGEGGVVTHDCEAGLPAGKRFRGNSQRDIGEFRGIG